MKNNKWIKKIKDSLFSHDNSPEMKSLSVALGTFIAFSPFMGFHILMAMGFCALYKKLDKTLVVGFTLVNNWWTLIPIYGTGLWIGEVLFKTEEHFDISTVKWSIFKLRHIISGETFTYITSSLKPIIIPFLAGSMILTVIVTILSYYITLYILKKNKVGKLKETVIS